eukprot:Rhum_TRINITY_DN15328_c2_g1::Rhum_TRINITY_DN15328_c2_g1_i1::g.152935::m.152935
MLLCLRGSFCLLSRPVAVAASFFFSGCFGCFVGCCGCCCCFKTLQSSRVRCGVKIVLERLQVRRHQRHESRGERQLRRTRGPPPKQPPRLQHVAVEREVLHPRRPPQLEGVRDERAEDAARGARDEPLPGEVGERGVERLERVPHDAAAQRVPHEEGRQALVEGEGALPFQHSADAVRRARVAPLGALHAGTDEVERRGRGCLGGPRGHTAEGGLAGRCLGHVSVGEEMLAEEAEEVVVGDGLGHAADDGGGQAAVQGPAPVELDEVFREVAAVDLRLRDGGADGCPDWKLDACVYKAHDADAEKTRLPEAAAPVASLLVARGGRGSGGGGGLRLRLLRHCRAHTRKRLPCVVRDGKKGAGHCGALRHFVPLSSFVLSFCTQLRSPVHRSFFFGWGWGGGGGEEGRVEEETSSLVSCRGGDGWVCQRSV